MQETVRLNATFLVHYRSSNVLFSVQVAEVTAESDPKTKAIFAGAPPKYDQTSGFFDEISCEALDRKAAGGERQKVLRLTLALVLWTFS